MSTKPRTLWWVFAAWVLLAIVMLNLHIWASYDRGVAMALLGLYGMLLFAVVTWWVIQWADFEIAARKKRSGP